MKQNNSKMQETDGCEMCEEYKKQIKELEQKLAGSIPQDKVQKAYDMLFVNGQAAHKMFKELLATI